MQVTETLSEGLKRSYAVTVPAADIDTRMRAKLSELGRTLRLPGFRPGKVPANLVRKRFGTSVLAEVMQDTLDSLPERVVQERGLRTAGQPQMTLASQPDLSEAIAHDLEVKLDVHLLPDITVPDLKAIQLTRLHATPDPEEIETALQRIASRDQSFEDIAEERGAEKGEFILADFKGSIDGVPFEGGTGTDVTIEVGGSGFIPGFTEQLDGIKAGETRTIDVTFPSEYHATEVAGKPAQFEITAKALKRGVTVPVGDALAQKNGFENLEEFRGAVTAQFQRELDGLSRLRIKRDLLDALAEKADFPSPENLLEAEFNAIWQRVEADRRAGREDDEDRGKDEETLKAEYRAIAERRVRLGLLLSEIGRAQDIQVTQAELTQALRNEASRYPGQEQQVVRFFTQNPGAIEQLRGPIFEDKVVDYILEIAQVETRDVPSSELSAIPETVPEVRPTVDLTTAAEESSPAEAEGEAA